MELNKLKLIIVVLIIFVIDCTLSSVIGEEQTFFGKFTYDNDADIASKRSTIYSREEIYTLYRKSYSYGKDILELVDFSCIRLINEDIAYGTVRLDDGSYALISFYPNGKKTQAYDLWMRNECSAIELFGDYLSGNQEVSNDLFYKYCLTPGTLMFSPSGMGQAFIWMAFYDGVVEVWLKDISDINSSCRCKFYSYHEIEEYPFDIFMCEDIIQAFLPETGMDLDVTETEVKESGCSLTQKKEDIFYFGSYEQDNDINNGKEPIEWLILSSDEDSCMLLSKYGIEARNYDDTYGCSNWTRSALRKWLNQEFFDTAFTEIEKDSMISFFEEDGSEEVINDKVKLLSIEEVERYLQSPEDRQCIVTNYVKWNKGVNIDESSCCWWWLRPPSLNKYSTIYVLRNGEIAEWGQWVDGWVPRSVGYSGYLAVRPVIVVRKKD